MNYLEEYKRLKEIALEKENNYDEYREDLTYFILEEFIIDILPKAFEMGIKNLKLCRISNVIGSDKIKISFNIKDVHPECIYNKKGYNYIGLLEYNKKNYGKVYIDKVKEYLQMIPGYSSYEESRGGSRNPNILNICFYYKAEEIINYYFEKLQELEYFNIDYKSLTKV